MVESTTLQQYGLEFYKRYYGFYKATVYDNKDPKNKWRIKISMPQMYDEVFDEWALPIGMPFGFDKQFQFLPQKGDEVWVSFENGDARRPLWLFSTNNSVEVHKETEPKYDNETFLKTKKSVLSFNDALSTIKLYVIGKLLGIVVDTKVNLGRTDVPYEPCVFGNTLENKLEVLISKQISLVTNVSGIMAAIQTESTTNAGIFSLFAPTNVALIASLQGISLDITNIQASLVQLKTELPAIKTANTAIN
jgi:Type VI secretion system/phage-baseplate injector OB domain